MDQMWKKVLRVASLWVVCFVLYWIKQPVLVLLPALVLASVNTYATLNTKIYYRQSEHEAILARTFGRFTWLATYGSISVLVVLGIACAVSPTPTTARFFLLGLGIFFLWGLYLCILVASGKK